MDTFYFDDDNSTFFQGLFAQNKEKLINGALVGLLEREGDQHIINAESLEAQFHALRRLVASKAGFQAFTNLPRYLFHCFNLLYMKLWASCVIEASMPQ